MTAMRSMRGAGLMAMALACAGQRLEYGSPDDVAAILAANGVEPTELRCKNPNSAGAVIRGVACTLTLSPAERARLIAALPMTRAPGRRADEPLADSCEAMPGLGSRTPGVEIWSGTNTKVTNGVGRVELHVGATDVACIEIAYPWSS